MGKCHVIAAAARNPNVIMWALHGVGTSRSLQGAACCPGTLLGVVERAVHCILVLLSVLIAVVMYYPKTRREWRAMPIAA